MAHCPTQVDVTDSTFVSVITPDDPDYTEDTLGYGVIGVGGRHVIGIGINGPESVLVGERDQLVRIATEILSKLGA
ncbi:MULTISPECIES: hypothetical protein [Mycolicibacter]|uniref:Uncharacterized protein n=1 Tax=Mycolicibacter longobardus TaxID=1108812 RepID=A0A1X1YBQ6_9MYCO|nr:MULTISPECIES: hypothetical protein [Mycolicibacter]ORW08486.1 hypothetical protein AWC16_18990 [Mycolicibacter longobardus]RAV04404.1 hypothetical protein DQP56_00875 [Mycolicibacter senuensis]